MSELLQQTATIAARYLATLDERPVARAIDNASLLASLGGSLPETGEDPTAVIRTLAERCDAGLVATPGPRFFGFVIGGAVPAALAADWLASAWDQNAFSFVLSPAAAVVEEVSRQWIADLLGLSSDVSLGMVTGATMANFTCIAAGRHAQLLKAGWNVEEDGLFGAPPLNVVVSDESHVTVFASLQMLGLGRNRVTRIPTDAQGRMRADALRGTLAGLRGPLVVCAQAGNVNTGAFDPIMDIAPIVHAAGGWLHVDGAFGAWAAASPKLKHLTAGLELADSVGVDAHKWLNVPYDCGFAITRDAAAHRAAMTLEAPYYVPSPNEARANHNFVPESSRRARGFAVYAALRSLGRVGISDLIERCCTLAQRMASRLGRSPRIRILNDVVLNQVLVSFEAPNGGDADAFTAAVIKRVQDDGTCWLGGTTWRGMHVMRISVSSWATTVDDIDRSADAILRAAE
ncbi:MAG: aminotransferase class V-fold PLP-dependent enzyme [Gemmatimonadaceae bacterium]